jgi:hypothetical protein
MNKVLQLAPVKHIPKKMLLRHSASERIGIDPIIVFYDKTIAFFNSHQPGKLVKDLYKLIFALMEHQANNEQPVNFASSIYDIKQLLQLLKESDHLQQTDELYTEHFFDMAVEFMYENNPTNLSSNLCRVLLDFIRFELQIGYPTFINEFLPGVLALLAWLNEGSNLVKLKPVKE